jgi:HEAT repeat protein
MFPRSPHKRDTERFEVAWQSLRSREAMAPDVRAALVRELRARLVADGIPEAVRGRVVFLLGRLQDPASVPTLVRLTREGTAELRREAILALAFFGNRAGMEGFTIFGGRIRWVVFPARHEAEATRGLIDVVLEPRPRRPPFPEGYADLPREERMRFLDERSEVVAAWSSRRWAAVRALESHETPGVETLALDLDPSWGPTLDLLAALDTPRTVDRLVDLARDAFSPDRNDAIEALGQTTRKAGVRALIDLLADGSPSVRRDADASLLQILDGNRPRERDAPGGEERRTYWRRRLGPDLEKLDEAALRRDRIRKPGVYQLRGW